MTGAPPAKILDVGQDLLDACDVEGARQLILDIEKDPEQVRMFQGSMGFRFPKHDEKGVLLWLDPEVRAWGRAVHESIPHLLYYMYPDPGAGALALLLFAFTHPMDLRPGTQEEMDAEAFERHLGTLSLRLVETALFAERMADDWQPIVTEILAPLEPPLADAAMNAVKATVTMSGLPDD